MSYLNPGVFSKCGHLWQRQISRTIWHEPNMLMDVFDRDKFQGPFSVDQMSQWTVWTHQMSANLYLVAKESRFISGMSGSKPILFHFFKQPKEKEEKWAKRTYCFYTFVFWNKWHYFPGDLIHYSLNLAILLLALCILRRYPFQSKISKGFSG